MILTEDYCFVLFCCSTSGVESSEDETQDPAERNRPPQRRNEEDLLQDSRQTLRNLAEANKNLK